MFNMIDSAYREDAIQFPLMPKLIYRCKNKTQSTIITKNDRHNVPVISDLYIKQISKPGY